MLAIKTPERSQWRRSSVVIVNSEHISLLSVSIVTFKQVYDGWDDTNEEVWLQPIK